MAGLSQTVPYCCSTSRPYWFFIIAEISYPRECDECSPYFLVYCTDMNVTEIFNNREIASIAWLFLFSVFVLRSKDVRKSLTGILRVFASIKMLLPMFLLAVYIGCIAYLLRKIGLWDVALLKDTLFWFLSAGLLTIYKYVSAPTGNVPVKRLLYDNLKLIVILEFILDTYTFALWVELLIVPVATIIVLMNAYVETTEGNRKVAKLLMGVQAILGLVLVAHAFYSAIVDYRVLGTLDTLRSILLPILLSIAIIPAAYLMAVYTNYESLFVGFKIGKEREDSFIRYCKWQVILHCGLSTKKIAQLRPFDLMQLESKKDVRKMLRRRDGIDTEEAQKV